MTNALNGRKAGLGTSCPLHQAEAKWFQIRHCDQEREPGVKWGKQDLYGEKSVPKALENDVN